MDYFQPVEINVLSAQDLNSKNLLFRPTISVAVSVTCGSRDHQVTPSAVYCKKLLRWNYRMRFYIEDDKIERNESVFVFHIKCKRLFRSEHVIGKVFVPIKLLRQLTEEKTITEHNNINFQVISKTGKPKGNLCLGFKFGSIVKGQRRVYDDSDNVRVREGCRLGVWGIIRHKPSAPCEDDLYA